MVTRDYLDLRLDQTRSEIDLRLGEIRATMATKVELAAQAGTTADILKSTRVESPIEARKASTTMVSGDHEASARMTREERPIRS